MIPEAMGAPVFCMETAAVTLLMIREGLALVWEGITNAGLSVAVYGADGLWRDGWWSLVWEQEDGVSCVMHGGRMFAFRSVRE
jgi:hypothetical protein